MEPETEKPPSRKTPLTLVEMEEQSDRLMVIPILVWFVDTTMLPLEEPMRPAVLNQNLDRVVFPFESTLAKDFWLLALCK